MPSLKTLFASAAMAYLATAKTIKITATSDDKFDPEEVEAEKGDVLEFHFEPKNHSVVAGDYRYPCSPLDLGSGFFSGFLPTDSGSAVCCNPSYSFYVLSNTFYRTRFSRSQSMTPTLLLSTLLRARSALLAWSASSTLTRTRLFPTTRSVLPS